MDVRRALSMIVLAFLLLPILVHAADGDDESLGEQVETIAGDVADKGLAFVTASSAPIQTVPNVFSSVYDAFQPGYCGDDWIGADAVIGLWVMPAVAITVVVLMGIALLYMLAQMLDSPQLTATAKDELFQVGLTLLRVFFLVWALGAADTLFSLKAGGISGDMVYSSNPLMIDAAMAFSRLMVSDMATHYSMLLIYNMIIHTIYSSTMWFGVSWRAMYSFNLGPVLKPIIDVVGTSLQFLSLGMSEWILHVITLCLIKKWMWTVFIPISMVLRAFPYTRLAGDSLFALCFALAVIYPLMFLIDYEVHKVMENHLVDSGTALQQFVSNSGILKIFGGVLAMMLLMGGVFIPFFLGSAINLAFELIRGAVYFIVIMSVIMPFINIFVTLTAAKEIARFFGTDVNFMSFLRII